MVAVNIDSFKPPRNQILVSARVTTAAATQWKLQEEDGILPAFTGASPVETGSESVPSDNFAAAGSFVPEVRHAPHPL